MSVRVSIRMFPSLAWGVKRKRAEDFLIAQAFNDKADQTLDLFSPHQGGALSNVFNWIDQPNATLDGFSTA